MVKCSFCSENGFSHLPFECKFCTKNFCSEHRLPESHNCKKLEKLKQDRREGYKAIFKRGVGEPRAPVRTPLSYKVKFPFYYYKKAIVVGVIAVLLIVGAVSAYQYVKANPQNFNLKFSLFNPVEQTVKKHFSAYSTGDRNVFMDTLDKENPIFYNAMLQQFDTIVNEGGWQVGYKRSLDEVKIEAQTNTTARAYVRYTDTLPANFLVPETLNYQEGAYMDLILRNDGWKISSCTCIKILPFG